MPINKLFDIQHRAMKALYETMERDGRPGTALSSAWPQIWWCMCCGRWRAAVALISTAYILALLTRLRYAPSVGITNATATVMNACQGHEDKAARFHHNSEGYK